MSKSLLLNSRIWHRRIASLESLAAASGKTMLIEHRAGGWILDLHDGAILEEWTGGKSGISKKVYSSVTGLALVFLTLSGFYFWYKPRQIRQAKNTRQQPKTLEELV